MESIAKGKYIRISPMKIRRVVKMLKDKKVNNVLNFLEILPHKGAKILRKIILSAVANFKYKNPNEDLNMLMIKQILVNQAPVLKRLMPRARGRADVIRKQSSHVIVVLTNE